MLTSPQPDWLRNLIRTTVQELGMYSEGVVELLMGTCAQESAFGKYKRQLGNGPALGWWQVEPATMRDLFTNYVALRPGLKAKLANSFSIEGPDLDRLENDPVYGIVLARLVYRRRPTPIPGPTDIIGLGRVWKHDYNTIAGQGTIAEFVNNYRKYCMKKADPS